MFYPFSLGESICSPFEHFLLLRRNVFIQVFVCIEFYLPFALNILQREKEAVYFPWMFGSFALADLPTIRLANREEVMTGSIGPMGHLRRTSSERVVAIFIFNQRGRTV
jgi:hypothetical protein